MKLIIRKLSIDANDSRIIDDLDIIGQVRIWIAETNKPTDYFILFQDDGQSLSVDTGIDSIDFINGFNPKIQAIFNKAKVALADYGKERKRGFHMDIKIPLTLAEKYQERLA